MADGMSIAGMLVEAVGAVASRPVVEVVAEERVGGRRLNASQAARLDRAGRLAAGSLDDRRRAARLVRSVADELAAEAEAEAVEADMERALAHLGPDAAWETVVEAEFLCDQDGAPLRSDGQLIAKTRSVRRVSRVDGLTSLWRAGALSEAERSVGEAYAALYASAMPPVRVSSYDGGSGGGRSLDKEAIMAAAMTRGFAARLLGEIRAACGDRNADVLEAVAGRGATVRSLGWSGKSAMRITQGLRDSLKVTANLLEKERSRSLDRGER